MLLILIWQVDLCFHPAHWTVRIPVISQNIDDGATEADGGASAPVGPSVATPLKH